MSFPARAISIFTAPSQVYQELSKRPTWLAPLLAVTLSISCMQVVVFFSEKGAAAMRQEFQEEYQKKMQSNAPPEAIDQQMAIARYAAPIAVLLFVPIVTLLSAGLVYLIFSIIMGGEATYRQTFSAWCHTGIIGVLGALVATAMIFIKGSAKSSTALSAFLPFLEEKSLVFKIFQGLDLFRDLAAGRPFGGDGNPEPRRDEEGRHGHLLRVRRHRADHRGDPPGRVLTFKGIASESR